MCDFGPEVRCAFTGRQASEITGGLVVEYRLAMQAVENKTLIRHLECILNVPVNLIEKIVGTVEAAVHVDIAVDFPSQ